MSKEILIINNNLDTGGVEIVLQMLVRRFSDRGYKITLWASNGDRRIIRKKYPALKFRKYPFWNMDCRRFSPKWLFSRACRLLFEKLLLRLKRWELVLAFKEGEDMLLASGLRARRKVAWVHTDYAHFHWTTYCFGDDNEAERRCMAGFDAVAAVSEAAAQGLRQAIGDPGNVSVVYNPIDAAAIEKKAQKLSPERPTDKTLLITVGRLSCEKRQAMLIDICHELSAEFPLELWIVGGGELEGELSRRIEVRGIDCVKMLGTQENPYPYIACSDWLISASETESYGLTVQEALILGVPVIACACPAIRESMSESFGILAGMEREQLKSAIRRALEDRELRRRCVGSIAKDYDKSGLFEQRLEKMYQFIVGE